MTLGWFLIGLTAHALIAVLARAFYARQDTVTPVVAAVGAVAINTTLAVILVGPLGLGGLALAIAIAAWVEATRAGRRPASPAARLPAGRDGTGGDSRRSAAAWSPGRSHSCAVQAVSWLGRDAPGWFGLLVRGRRGRGRLRARLRRDLARLADPGTADYRRSHGRRPPPPATRVTPPGRADPLPADSTRICGLGRVRRGSSDPGSYLQSGGWAAVKAVNGWARDPLASSDAPGGRVGAQVLLRRPAGMPWAFAYAPRGPVADGLDGRPASRPSPNTSGATCRAGPGGWPRLRIDPEIEIDGPQDADGAVRARADRRRLAPGDRRPARRDPDRRPAPGRGRAVGRPAQEVAPVRQQGPHRRDRRRGRGRGPARGVLSDLPRDRGSRRVPHPDRGRLPRRLGGVSAGRQRAGCCSPRPPTASRSPRSSSSAAGRGSSSRTAG